MFPDIPLICDQPIFRVSATDAVVSDCSNHKGYKRLSLCFRKCCSLGFTFQFHRFSSVAGISGRSAGYSSSTLRVHVAPSKSLGSGQGWGLQSSETAPQVRTINWLTKQGADTSSSQSKRFQSQAKLILGSVLWAWCLWDGLADTPPTKDLDTNMENTTSFIQALQWKVLNHMCSAYRLRVCSREESILLDIN